MPAEIFKADLKGPIRKQLHHDRARVLCAGHQRGSGGHASHDRRERAASRRSSAELFWEAGPKRTQLAFESFLREEVDGGKLDIPDLHRADDAVLLPAQGRISRTHGIRLLRQSHRKRDPRAHRARRWICSSAPTLRADAERRAIRQALSPRNSCLSQSVDQALVVAQRIGVVRHDMSCRYDRSRSLASLSRSVVPSAAMRR